MNKSKEEILLFLNNCYSKEKAYVFFEIKSTNHKKRDYEL